MPARVIRGEINSSRSLSRVSLEADLTFRALLVAVDDYGRIDADPIMLRVALFPRRPTITEDQIETWVAELAAQHCVVVYEVDGGRYLALTKWEKYRGKTNRAKESKCPPVPRKAADLRESPGDPGRIPPRSSSLSSSSSSISTSGQMSEPEAARASKAARPPEKSTEPEPEPAAPATGFGAWSPPAEKREMLAGSTVFAEARAAAAAAKRV